MAQALAGLEPAVDVRVAYADVLERLSYQVIAGQSENSVAILLSGYSFVSLRHETMASITDSIS